MEFYKLPLSRLVLYLCSLIISNEYDTVIFFINQYFPRKLPPVPGANSNYNTIDRIKKGKLSFLCLKHILLFSFNFIILHIYLPLNL